MLIRDQKYLLFYLSYLPSFRQKKKKIPLCTGEEVDMDLNDMEPDSPVLWLRLDPDLELIRMVKLDQPDFMWQYMLRHERCVVSQAQVG